MRNFNEKDFNGREGLSIEDAAHVAGLGKTTILDLIKGGAIPARRFGRRILVLRTDLVAFLAALPRFEVDTA